MDNMFVIAIINAGGDVLAAAVAGGVAALIGKRFLSQQVLKKQLEVARNDIAFLLKVERRHCVKHKKFGQKSLFNTVRQEITQEGGYWSGKHTPGRVK